MVHREAPGTATRNTALYENIIPQKGCFYEKLTLVTSLLISAFSFSAMAADQVSKEEISHFNLVKIGNVNVSQSGGQIGSPNELHKELSKLADDKGGKYYHIIAATQKGPNFEAIAAVYKDAGK